MQEDELNEFIGVPRLVTVYHKAKNDRSYEDSLFFLLKTDDLNFHLVPAYSRLTRSTITLPKKTWAISPADDFLPYDMVDLTECEDGMLFIKPKSVFAINGRTKYTQGRRDQLVHVYSENETHMQIALLNQSIDFHPDKLQFRIIKKYEYTFYDIETYPEKFINL